MNYGAIGAAIGHEISHSFDNLGAGFDARGRLRNWWTPADLAHFNAAAEQLVRQYDGYWAGRTDLTDDADEDFDEEAGGGTGGGAGRPAPALPAAFVRAAEDLLGQDPAADGPTLRAWLISGGSDGLAVDEDAVALSTFHAAKGLEWPTVVVIGLVPGLVPHAGARTPVARDEERRLLHVAVTRAEREVVLTWFGAERSPYLDVLDLAEQVGGTPVAPPADLRPVPSGPPVDPILVALRAWRHDAARAARVDEQAVADDRTLAAIAAAPPSHGRGARCGPRVRPAHGATPRDAPAGRDRSRPRWARAGASVSALTGRPPLHASAAHAGGQSRSTTTGAWSEGCLPLRALRSIERPARRAAATGAVASTRSMRMPRPSWKSPAR